MSGVWKRDQQRCQWCFELWRLHELYQRGRRLEVGAMLFGVFVPKKQSLKIWATRSTDVKSSVFWEWLPFIVQNKLNWIFSYYWKHQIYLIWNVSWWGFYFYNLLFLIKTTHENAEILDYKMLIGLNQHVFQQKTFIILQRSEKKLNEENWT